MMKSKRVVLALCTGLLVAGVATAPGAYAVDAMKGTMHKHMMKKHKDSMMKSDAMHKDDATKTAPAQ